MGGETNRQIEFESNHKQIGLKLYLFTFNLFVKQIEILGFRFVSFMKQIFSLICLIHLAELINKSNQIKSGSIYYSFIL